jgi:hypothetical protein
VGNLSVQVELVDTVVDIGADIVAEKLAVDFHYTNLY